MLFFKKQNEEIINEELERTNLLFEEMRLKLQFSDEENKLLKFKLNVKANEIDELKINLDSTKDQLIKITEKVNNLNINEKQENGKLGIVTVEQEIQTEVINMSLTNKSEQKSSVNISCQTCEIPTVETNDQNLQTSFFLSSSPVLQIKKEVFSIKLTFQLHHFIA